MTDAFVRQRTLLWGTFARTMELLHARAVDQDALGVILPRLKVFWAQTFGDSATTVYSHTLFAHVLDIVKIHRDFQGFSTQSSENLNQRYLSQSKLVF